MLLLALVAIAPGVSIIAGLLLMIPAFEMIVGKPAPVFPRWIAARPLPMRHLAALVQRAVPVLKYLEKAIHPRWPTPFEATKRLVGAVGCPPAPFCRHFGSQCGMWSMPPATDSVGDVSNAIEAKYHANIFLQMLTDNGGLATAKTLINAPKPSDGYAALFLRKRLDLTVEAVVVEQSRWHSLFTEEELERARRRLVAYGYVVKAAS